MVVSVKFSDDYIYKRVLDFAMKGHEGQFRKDGVTPFVQHPIRVANQLAHDGYGIIFQVIALLHDYIEDAADRNVAKKQVYDLLTSLYDENTTDDIYVSLILLTRGEDESVKKYHRAIYGNRYAITVKVYDKLDNVHDMEGVFSDEKIVEYCVIIEDFVKGLSNNSLISGDEVLYIRLYNLIADSEYYKQLAKDRIKPFIITDLNVIEYTRVPCKWEIQLPYDGKFRTFRVDEYGDKYIIYTIIEHRNYYHLVNTHPSVLFVPPNMDIDVFQRACCFDSLEQIIDMINKYIAVESEA